MPSKEKGGTFKNALSVRSEPALVLRMHQLFTSRGGGETPNARRRVSDAPRLAFRISSENLPWRVYIQFPLIFPFQTPAAELKVTLSPPVLRGAFLHALPRRCRHLARRRTWKPRISSRFRRSVFAKVRNGDSPAPSQLTPGASSPGEPGGYVPRPRRASRETRVIEYCCPLGNRRGLACNDLRVDRGAARAAL